MDSEKKTDFKVGLTVLVGLLILIVGIGWAKSWHFGPKGQTVRAYFPTAGGLEVGDPVTVNGLKKGTVSTVDLRDSNVLVTMNFTDPVDLRQDAQASITMLELMGGKKVELLKGSSTVPLSPSTILYGNYSGDISSLVAMVSSLSGQLRSITVQADTLLASLNGVFRGGRFSTNMDQTFSNARTTLAAISTTAKHADLLLTQNQGTLSRTFTQADDATRNLSEILHAERPGMHSLLDSTNQFMREARNTVSNANRIFGDLDSVLGKNGNENTLLYRFTRDKSFSLKLDSTLYLLDKFLEQVRTQGIDANIRFFNSSKPAK